jgi:TP901 family phage tail tape measure protein
MPELARPSGMIQGGIGAAQRNLALLAERYRQADPLATMNFGNRMAALKRDPNFLNRPAVPQMVPGKTQKETIELYQSLVKLSQGGVLASGTLRTITSDLNPLLKNLGLSKVEIEQVNTALKTLSHIGAIRLGMQRGGGQQDLTQGGKPDYQQIFSPQRMQFPAAQAPGSVVGTGGVYGGVAAVKNMTEELKRQGGSVSDLKDVTMDGATQTTKWTGQMQVATGVVKNFSVVTGNAGQVLHSTARGFRSWGSAIARDIGEFAKWSIAAAAIYVPMRKLQELFQESMEIQTKLADIQISVGGSAAVTAKVFDAASDVAAKLGVSLKGVMEGYVLAYRAAGQIVEPTKRAMTATQLLNDSMILSKLSGMDQAEALDTLVGSLRQLNLPLDQGVTLLDKWVAVTKVANVDLKTLSTSFAITATAAENAGLSVDRLNAIIAVVAETTVLSATEAGNAVRAFMSGFTRPESGESLAKFGISIKTITGDLKSFDEISREISERRKLGLIDDQAFAKLSETLGGRGARRGAQVQAYLSNIPRVEQVAAASANASGDASKALEIQLGTLETAVTRLGVAFSEMSRALGSEGGFLDMFTNMANAGVGLIGIFNGIIRTLATATPALLSFTAAMILLRKSSALQAFGQRTLFDILGGTMVPSGPPGPGGKALSAVPPTDPIRSKLYQMFAGRPAMEQPLKASVGGSLRGGGWGTAAGGLGTGLMMSFMSGSLVGDQANLKKAGATISASLISQVIAGGNPIGGMIGGAIATALYDNLIDREVDLVSAFERIFTQALTPPGGPGPGGPTRREELTSDIFKGLGGILQFEEIGRLGAGMAAAGGTKRFRPKEEDIENYAVAMAGLASGRVKGGPGAELAMMMFLPKMTPEAREELGKFWDEAMALGMKAAEEVSGEIPATAFGSMIRSAAEQYGSVAKDVFSAQKQDVTGQIGRGETGVKALTDLQGIEAGFPADIATIYAAMTANGKKAGISFKELAELIIELSSEEAEVILATTSAIEAQVNAIDELKNSGADAREVVDSVEELYRLQELLNLQTKESSAGKKYREFEEPGYVRVAAGTDPKLIQQGLAAAAALSEQYAKSATPDPALQQKIYKGWGEIGILTVDAITGEIIKLPGVFSNIWDEILAQQFEKLGILSDNTKIGLEKLDIPASELPQLFGNMEFWKKKLQTTSYGSQIVATEPTEKVLFVTDDGVLKELQIQRTVFGLAYDMMIKNQEKQLEGIFNIPEGMTAMIPYTGKLFFSDQPIDKGTDVGNLLEQFGPPVDKFGTSTGVFEGAVNKFAGLIGATPAGAAAQEAKLARMEEEFEKEWEAANPPPAAAPDPEAIARAQRMAEISARKEADYIPEPDAPTAGPYGGRGMMGPEQVGGQKPFGDWINDIFNSMMENYQTGADKYKFDPEEVKAMGPGGEGILEWIKSVFATLGDLATTFSEAWNPGGGASGGDVQKGLSEAERQNLLPTEGPKLDTSDIGEDLKYIFDALGQTFQQIFGLFAQELGIGGAVGGGKGLAKMTEQSGGGITGGASGGIYMQPLSLPVTINTRIVNQTSILLDGYKIQQAINERQNTTLKTASRRAGTGGFIVEA